eukprot:Sspe_Gene.38894::Locus_18754_Transcript_1_1_Confidence_1.000_Length_6623::g.38894::m.38894
MSGGYARAVLRLKEAKPAVIKPTLNPPRVAVRGVQRGKTADAAFRKNHRKAVERSVCDIADHAAVLKGLALTGAYRQAREIYSKQKTKAESDVFHAMLWVEGRAVDLKRLRKIVETMEQRRMALTEEDIETLLWAGQRAVRMQGMSREGAHQPCAKKWLEWVVGLLEKHSIEATPRMRYALACASFRYEEADMLTAGLPKEKRIIALLKVCARNRNLDKALQVWKEAGEAPGYLLWIHLLNVVKEVGDRELFEEYEREIGEVPWEHAVPVHGMYLQLCRGDFNAARKRMMKAIEEGHGNEAKLWGMMLVSARKSGDVAGEQWVRSEMADRGIRITDRMRETVERKGGPAPPELSLGPSQPE